MSKPRLGFIGLGIMGRPMVKNLLKAGYNVTVWNRSEPGIIDTESAGATRAASPAAVAEVSDVVLSCVTDSPDVEKVYLQDNGVIESARSGMICIDHSTISPTVARGVAEQMASKGVSMLDAPISGGEVGAIEARLSIMVGGDEDTFNTCQPIFEAMGQRITYIGASGAGQTTKLCNQIAGSLNNLAACEALLLAAKSGINMEAMLEAISGGAAGSWVLDNLAPKVLKRDFDPGFMIRLQQKDLRLVIEAAKELKLALPGTTLVNQLFQAVEARDLGDEGVQALAKSLEWLNDVEASGSN
jgi:3-hydroxyisobutyrate dehydrogenase